MAQYVKGQNDKEFRTSDGFFRDPITGKELTGQEPRVHTELRTPRIMASDGKTEIPIAYKLWTKEERVKFNEGSIRSSGSSKKNAELREALLGLQAYLDKKLPGDKTVSEVLGKLMPPDPAVERAEKKLQSFVDKLSDADKAELLKKLSA